METLNLRELEQLNTLRLNIRRSMSQGEGLRRSSAKDALQSFPDTVNMSLGTILDM